MDRIAGLQDLQDEGLGLSWGLTMDRMAGLQDLQDRVLGLAGRKQWTGLQDYKIYRIEGCGLAGGCTDRMAVFRRLWQVSRSMSSE